ncbi:hypothetical protein [Heliorestis convoluta]|uniref:Putative membrane protein n=1 Tax=Heliorestis convoluta TaxID=356322 RepID=A0A5Q2MVX6_9FIRM|nr:hypothetical protein [Heliorestis convoluta]QGG46378.1 putative membrane protein [Heliorestis convoluta]
MIYKKSYILPSTLMLFFIFLLLSGCNTKQEVAEEEIKVEKIDVAIDFSYKVNSNRFIQFTVTTNLPDGMKLGLGISNNDGYSAGDNVVVKNGMVKSTWFSNYKNLNSSLDPGEYKFRVFSIVPNLQPVSVREYIGEEGENLTGEYVKYDSISGNLIRFEKYFTIE